MKYDEDDDNDDDDDAGDYDGYEYRRGEGTRREVRE